MRDNLINMELLQQQRDWLLENTDGHKVMGGLIHLLDDMLDNLQAHGSVTYAATNPLQHLDTEGEKQ